MSAADRVDFRWIAKKKVFAQGRDRSPACDPAGERLLSALW